jgi:hypothetical protein
LATVTTLRCTCVSLIFTPAAYVSCRALNGSLNTTGQGQTPGPVAQPGHGSGNHDSGNERASPEPNLAHRQRHCCRCRRPTSSGYPGPKGAGLRRPTARSTGGMGNRIGIRYGLKCRCLGRRCIDPGRFRSCGGRICSHEVGRGKGVCGREVRRSQGIGRALLRCRQRNHRSSHSRRGDRARSRWEGDN